MSNEEEGNSAHGPNEFLDRWRLTVDLFGRVFCDDVGLEPGSVIRQLGGFQLKEAKFRREMERLRNISNRELTMEVDRDRDLLLQMTFKSLNNMYSLQTNRRAAAAAAVNVNTNTTSATGTSSANSTHLPPPLCLNRIKVTFKEEQGEGSGVARSFYTAFAEAVLADARLPVLDLTYYPVNQTPTNVSSISTTYAPFNMLQRYRSRGGTDRRPLPSAIPTSTVTSSRSSARRDQHPILLVNQAIAYAAEAPNESPTSLQPPLSANALPFYSPLIAITSSTLSDLPSFDLTLYNSLDSQYRDLGQQLYTKTKALLQQTQPQLANNTTKVAKIVGMMLELRSNSVYQLITLDSLLRLRIDEALTLLAPQSEPALPSYTSSLSVQLAPPATPQTKPEPTDNSPLFWQPDKNMPGFFSPRAGLKTAARLNAFRNVGRIVAICLLQNELCPIAFSRHVIKFVLNRPIKWHDLAFFDSQMYESFRKMINDAESFLLSALAESKATESKASRRAAFKKAIANCNTQIFDPLDLSFSVDLGKEEEGGNHELIEDGSKIKVDYSNVYEFVKRYAEFRMVKHAESCLQELRAGLLDVLPASALVGLTAEDFRLLLNGVADINIHILASYTTISDESKESSRRPQFEKWFWTTLERMSQQEKQELLFFWTGSPYLPASEEGFQPLPTITLRPPSDQHLPTANTCINRLYVPMYSSKSILKTKLLQAIKTKTFGFV